MRTPGLGLRRRNSTSGVLPIAWTMSPYLPPQGRVLSPGSSTSESVVRCRAGLEGDVLLTEPGLLRQDGVLVRVGGRAAAQEAQRLVPGRPHLVADAGSDHDRGARPDLPLVSGEPHASVAVREEVDLLPLAGEVLRGRAARSPGGGWGGAWCRGPAPRSRGSASRRAC